MRSTRAVIVTTHPIQYQAPLFRKLAERFDLTVVFLMRQTARGQAESGFGREFEWDIPLLNGYDHRFATNVARNASSSRRDGIVLSGHAELLQSLQPDVLMLFGWFPRGYLQVIDWATANRIPLVCRGESNLLSSGQSLAKRTVKRFYFTRLFKRFRAFACIGERNREFYEHYGVPETKLHSAPYSVDTDFFHREFTKHRPTVRRAGRWRFGFAGKLIPMKRPLDLILAAGKCAWKDQLELVLIGDGPLRDEIELVARRENVVIHFRGFLNQSEIVARGYADLDALVLPSGVTETWGLVINEAMTGGIPAIVSETVGSAPDLIEVGSTGYVFRTGDIEDLASSIDCLVTRLVSGHDFSPAVLQRIFNYSLDRTADGVEAALCAAVEEQ